jgi:60 kDa SS-A/Ro ribonucleoprotein
MRMNTTVSHPAVFTHEGAPASRINAEKQLRRSVMACMLWENSFYESGQDIATRIAELVKQVPADKVHAIAVEAREEMKLRHVPLLLVTEMAKLKTHRHIVAETAEAVIQRPDELAEVLAIYSKGRTGDKKLNKLSKQLQKGVAAAFRKFDEYSLAKYNQDREIKLRDVLFLTHAKPVGGKTGAQARLWKRLIDNELKTPDTWEVALSAATDKKAEWTRLLQEEKLGALALLRNLRNMREANVDEKSIRYALLTMKTERVLPFRFVAAAKFAPQLEDELEQAMFKSLADFEKLPGKTVIVVDNSASMYSGVSAKSDLTRADAAAALAMLVREVCEQATVIAFSNNPRTVPSRRGFALREAIQTATSHSSTNTQYALNLAQAEGYDRIIVITDEQSHQQISAPKSDKAYFINVASNENGIGYGKWTHIDGWSEAVLQYIIEAENEN